MNRPLSEVPLWKILVWLAVFWLLSTAVYVALPRPARPEQLRVQIRNASPIVATVRLDPGWADGAKLRLQPGRTLDLPTVELGEERRLSLESSGQARSVVFTAAEQEGNRVVLLAPNGNVRIIGPDEPVPR